MALMGPMAGGRPAAERIEPHPEPRHTKKSPFLSTEAKSSTLQ
jgi:hypothetical protein